MQQEDEKLLRRLSLINIPGLGVISMNKILQTIGDEALLFELSEKELIDKFELNKGTAKLLREVRVGDIEKKELEFIRKNNIRSYFILDDDYPDRLKECPDAPILLFQKGECNLNSQKIISIVGTRNSTSYGNEFCESFIREVSDKLRDDLLIVSGLAYGIDIAAHKAALKYDIPTVGVLAHGLDRIYPALHRNTAASMINNGGLLTEFFTGTQPDRFNFVTRNRIVAGMCDAVVIIESNRKGGALITAQLGNSYNKDVFALPGKITDKRSEGCNYLISNHQADILLSPENFIEQMGWNRKGKKKPSLQQNLFIEETLTEEEKPVYNLLKEKGPLHIDIISRELNTETYSLLSILFQLEMAGKVHTLPGSCYSL